MIIGLGFKAAVGLNVGADAGEETATAAVATGALLAPSLPPQPPSASKAVIT